MTGGTTHGSGVCISFCPSQLDAIFAFTYTPTTKIHVIPVHISILPGFQLNSPKFTSDISWPGLKQHSLSSVCFCFFLTFPAFPLCRLCWAKLLEKLSGRVREAGGCLGKVLTPVVWAGGAEKVHNPGNKNESHRDSWPGFISTSIAAQRTDVKPQLPDSFTSGEEPGI